MNYKDKLSLIPMFPVFVLAGIIVVIMFVFEIIIGALWFVVTKIRGE